MRRDINSWQWDWETRVSGPVIAIIAPQLSPELWVDTMYTWPPVVTMHGQCNAVLSWKMTIILQSTEHWSNVVCISWWSQSHGWMIESVQSNSLKALSLQVEPALSPLIMFSQRANHDNMRASKHHVTSDAKIVPRQSFEKRMTKDFPGVSTCCVLCYVLSEWVKLAPLLPPSQSQPSELSEFLVSQLMWTHQHNATMKWQHKCFSCLQVAILPFYDFLSECWQLRRKLIWAKYCSSVSHEQLVLVELALAS